MVPSPQLNISDELINELENYRVRHKMLFSPTPLAKGRVVTDVASILNRFWKSEIKIYLEGKPWRDSMKFLQDIVGDEFKKEGRPGLLWLQGKLLTKEFVSCIAGRVRSCLK